MTTLYQHRITLACPESLMPQANQLALIVGESVHDDQTFTAARYEDASGNKFAVCSLVATEGFLAIPGTGLPPSPSYAEDADRTGAQQALDSLTVWISPEEPSSPPTIDGLMMAVDINPHKAIQEWGLVAIEDVI